MKILGVYSVRRKRGILGIGRRSPVLVVVMENLWYGRAARITRIFDLKARGRCRIFLSFKALRSTQFSKPYAQLWMCRGA